MDKMKQKVRRLERAIDDYAEAATRGEVLESLQRIINTANDLMNEAENIKEGRNA